MLCYFLNNVVDLHFAGCYEQHNKIALETELLHFLTNNVVDVYDTKHIQKQNSKTQDWHNQLNGINLQYVSQFP